MGKILKLFKNEAGSVLVTILLVILAIGIAGLLPLLFIFGLRLLGVEVGYSWGTWFGALIVISILSASSSSGKK
jgi:hypothetical protein